MWALCKVPGGERICCLSSETLATAWCLSDFRLWSHVKVLDREIVTYRTWVKWFLFFYARSFAVACRPKDWPPVPESQFLAESLQCAARACRSQAPSWPFAQSASHTSTLCVPSAHQLACLWPKPPRCSLPWFLSSVPGLSCPGTTWPILIHPG